MKNLRNTLWALVGLFGLATLVAAPAAADQVILDDLIVDGSLCVGFDCVNGESFGFDTIRLKENNLRIKAQDTSTSASFPTQDWQLTFNDTSNGGANKFAIDCISPGSSTPFTIEGCAPTNSLFVEDSGDIGFGTSTPVVELHVVDGDTPTLRLEQDGSSGFTPQIFDVAANETNFFVRDATNGSTLPFRIKPGSPSNSIFVENPDGDVGMGTASPEQPLHIVDNSARLLMQDNDGTGAETMVILENGGPVRIRMDDVSRNRWEQRTDSNSDYTIINVDTTMDFVFAGASGNLTIDGSIFTGGGTCGGGCDAVFEPGFELASIEEHAEQMWQNGYLPNVGPTPENAPINLSDKTGRMLHELELAHIYIEKLNAELSAKSEQIQLLLEQQSRIEELLANLER